MAGSIYVPLETEKKTREVKISEVLLGKAVSQGISDSPTEIVVRDVLPLSDLGGTTTGATSATSGYRFEEWRIDMRTYQRDGSTAVSTNAYNVAVNINLNKEKVWGIYGVEKRGEDAVSAIRFSLGSGAKIKDIWQIDNITVGESMYAEDPIVYNSTNTAKVEYYLKAPAIIYHQMLGKVAEARGDTILGAE